MTGARAVVEPAPSPTEVVLFQHMPKTAGTSLRRVLEANYGPGELVNAYWGAEGRHQPAPGDARAYRQWFWGLEHSQRERMRCVAAHNAACLIGVLDRPFRVLSLLRDPIERVVSLYHTRVWQAQRDRTPGWGREIGHEMNQRGWSLADVYLNLGGAEPASSPLHGLFGEFFNGQARIVLKAHDRDGELGYWAGTPDAAMAIRRAVMASLTRHYVVGVQERFAESLDLFAQAFGWRNVLVSRKNVRNPQPVDPDTRALIAAHNQLDLEIHAHYEAMLTSPPAGNHQPPLTPRRRPSRAHAAKAPRASATGPAGPTAVLGAPGSGSSLTAGALELLGADFGPEHRLTSPAPWEWPTGSWEHRLLAELSERLLTVLGAGGAEGQAWRHPPRLPAGWECDPSLASLRRHARQLVAASFGERQGWAWKDPRASLTLPFWQLLLGPTRHVICVRHPLDVAACLQRRAGLERGHALELWARYSTAAVLNTAGQPRIVLSHEQWLQSPRRQLERLAAFAAHPSSAPMAAVLDAIEAEIEQPGSNGRAGVGPTQDAALPVEVAELYRALARAGEDAPGAGELERAAAQAQRPARA